MLSNKKEIKKYIEKLKFFKDCKIIWVKSGLSNHNYLFEASGKKYILRMNIPRPSGKIKPLKNEHLLLKFLKMKKIDYVPGSFYFDSKLNIHILEYIEGRKTAFKQLGKDSMEDAILKLHNINILAKEFISYCQKRGEKIGEPVSEINAIKKEIFKKMKADYDNKFLIKIKQETFKALKDDFNNKRTSKRIVYLNHGDPADNLIVRNKLIKIIDWEFVRFTYGPGLVHILAHGRLEEKKENHLIKFYSRISGISHKTLLRKTLREKKIYYLYKIAMIYEKYSRTDSRKKRDAEEDFKNIKNIMKRYKKIAY
jgi:hypothetical protein